MDDEAKARLIANVAGAMQGVPREIQLCQMAHFMKADPAYAAGIAKSLGIDRLEIS